MLCFPIALSSLLANQIDFSYFKKSLVFFILLLTTKTTFLSDVQKAFHGLVPVNRPNLMLSHFTETPLHHTVPSLCVSALNMLMKMLFHFCVVSYPQEKSLSRVYFYSLQSITGFLFLLGMHP